MSGNDIFKRTGSQDFSKFLKVMVSGPPKSGKTTLLGTVPNILVLDTEPFANNLDSIAHLDLPYVTITNSDDLRHVAMILGNDSLRQQLAQTQYGMQDIGAVAIDTLDTFQKILKAERMKEQRSSQFLRDDWGWLKAEMEEIVQMFTALPMHVFFMVHLKNQEVGKGDEAYTTFLPGLEGAIAQSIAGMVGYSLLSFRQEEVGPDGTPVTKYYLRTEGDRTYDFLGTRTAGRLPTVIEPSIKTIYDTVMAARPKSQPQAAVPNPGAVAPLPQQAQAPAPAAAPAAPSEAEDVAQNAGQAEEVQTPVQTPQETPAAPTAPQQPPAERPDSNEPVTPAAMGHVKRVYDALEISFPQEIVAEKTMGDARNLVSYWRAMQKDYSEGKGTPGNSPQSEMLELMEAQGWLPADGAEPAEVQDETPAKIDGTIEEVVAYVTQGGDGADLDRVQEAYNLEVARGDKARKGLVTKLESLGAKPAVSSVDQKQFEQPVSTPVETTEEPAEAPAEAVTPSDAPADTPPTDDEAVKAVEEGLGGTLVEESVNPEAKCADCGGELDDLDLAELGKKRFDKLLCVSDYLAQLKK